MVGHCQFVPLELSSGWEFPSWHTCAYPHSEVARVGSFCFLHWVYCRGNTGRWKVTAKSSYCGSVVTGAGMVCFRNSCQFLFCYRGSPDRDGMVSISMTIFSRFAPQYMLYLIKHPKGQFLPPPLSSLLLSPLQDFSNAELFSFPLVSMHEKSMWSSSS